MLQRQESDFEDIGRVVAEAAAASSEPCGGVRQALINQIKAVRDRVLIPHGVNIAGLAGRGNEVLGPSAEGWGAKQIAGKLGYSEWTAKGIVRGVVARLGLRSRTRAVGHTLCTGGLRAEGRCSVVVLTPGQENDTANCRSADVR